MHATARRLVRVVPRNVLNVAEEQIYHRPRPQIEDIRQPTVIDMLEQKKVEAGAAWPTNIRIERQLTKDVFKDVVPDVRSLLKKMTKER
ncbi:hypothetical protein CPB83DRAFT_84793 [Crepidotus variabilis]|uniref:Uncharacterized protein n=1 Tax=Crepidotus variabilis TaxID=179855 RepID=A0A9P6EMB6_9AGAR|nr:hypothetical protein CPB83DRAFT_84793 [Crepidotus variabilis]